MARMTLLEIVQSILSDMDDDNVNSISDTPESLQVASIVKDSFYDIINRRDWEHLKQLLLLDSVSDTAKPNYLKLPDNVNELEFIQYNKRKSTDTRDRFEEVEYLAPDHFLMRQNGLNESNSSITQITDFTGVKFNIYNDRGPTYWTSFDDEYIVFDAYDSVVEATMQGSKSQCRAVVEPSWSPVDTFVPDLPQEYFTLLLEEAKSVSFLNLKQVMNEKSEQKSRRHQRRLSQKGWRAKSSQSWPNYGRKTRYKNHNPYIDKT